MSKTPETNWRGQFAPPHIIFYTKPGCHLCEDAAALLKSLRGEFEFTVEEIDITTDREIFKQYFEKIPVFVVDGRTTIAAPIRAEEVRAALKS